MSDIYLDNIHEATAFLRSIGHELDSLGESFLHTGNETVGILLIQQAKHIYNAQKKITAAVSTELSRQVSEGKKANADLLTAILGDANRKMSTSGDK